MNFICTQKNLQKGIYNVSHVAGKNSTLPILNNILLEVNKSGLKLSSTDLEIGINSSVRGKTEKEGSIAVPVKIFSDYISNLPDGQVSLEVKKDNVLTLESQNFKAEIKGFSAKDFPIIPKIEGKLIAKIKADEFKRDLEGVVFAASQDESRPEITGVYLDFLKNNTIVVATDSYRLVERNIKQKESITEPVKIIIPSKTILELIRLIDEESENIEVRINANQALFSLNDVYLTSRLIEGKYPDYKQIMPENYTTRVKVNLSELLKIIKTASLFAKPGVYDINFDIKKDGKLIVAADTDQVGNASSYVNAEVEGEPQKINFNYRYILEGLNNINTKDVYLEISNESSPTIIKPTEGSDYTYLVMPIRQ